MSFLPLRVSSEQTVTAPAEQPCMPSPDRRQQLQQKEVQRLQLNQQLRRSQRTASRLLKAGGSGYAARAAGDGATSEMTAGSDACGGDEACSASTGSRFQVRTH